MTDYYSDWTDLEFIREFAKCGINYNHSHNEERLTNLLTRLDKSIQELSSKEQECEELKKQMDFANQYKTDVIERQNTELASLRAENERLSGLLLQETGKAMRYTQDIANFRKRCEDLEAEIESMKRNRLEHWIKLLSQ